MFKGIVFALSACLIWGMIFIVPQFMEGFNSIEVALGRYFCYGIISAVIFSRAIFQGMFRYPLSTWLLGLKFSLITTIGYYPFVVLALRYSSPAICALVLGISPITIAFYGNWKLKECDFRSLLLPAILIVIGMGLINAPQFIGDEFPTTYMTGIFCALLALVTWTWYAVANAKLLKEDTGLASSDWSTMMGVTTLFWVAIFGVIFGVFFNEHFELEKYLSLNPALIKFMVGSAVLGFICSWFGAYLWNRASVYLPVSLAGQLMIFETVFGLIFVYLLEQSLPPLLEFLGIVILLAAISYGIRMSYQNGSEPVVA